MAPREILDKSIGAWTSLNILYRNKSLIFPFLITKAISLVTKVFRNSLSIIMSVALNLMVSCKRHVILKFPSPAEVMLYSWIRCIHCSVTDSLLETQREACAWLQMPLTLHINDQWDMGPIKNSLLKDYRASCLTSGHAQFWGFMAENDVVHLVQVIVVVFMSGMTSLGRMNRVIHQQHEVSHSVVKNIDISISIDTEISERYQY